MDNKKRAQAAWAVLLALLALLFGVGSSLGRNTDWSESPTEDPAGEESGQENQQRNEQGSEDGAEDGSEDTTGDSAGDGWTVEDGDDQAGQDDDPLREPTWGEDDTQNQQGTTGDDGSPVEDRQDEFPDPGGENTNDQSNEELFPPDATEDSTTYGNEPAVELDSIEDLRDHAARTSTPSIGAPDVGAENQSFHADGTGLFEWARENPGQVALIVGGVAAPFGATAYVAAGGTSMALSASQAASLAAVGVPATTYENATQRMRDAIGVDEDSTTGGTGDTTDPSGGQDTIEGSRGTQQDGAVEEPDNGGSTADEDWQPEDGGHSPGPGIDPDDDSDDQDDSSSGRGGPDGGEGDFTPDLDPIDIPDELSEDNDQDNDTDTVWDPTPEERPDEDSGPDDDDQDDGGSTDFEDVWMPGTGGHTPGVI